MAKATSKPRLKFQKNNAAGRLLEILTNIRDANQSLSLYEVIEQVFGERTADGIEVHTFVVEMHSLYCDIKLYTDATKPVNHYWRNPLGQLRGIVAPTDLRIKIEAYRGRITSEVTLFLNVAADEMPEESEITVGDLDGIRDAIAESRRIVLEVGIGQGLKCWLLELLQMMEAAVARYEISGARLLRGKLQSMAWQLAEAYRPRKEASEKGDEQAVRDVAAMDSVGKLIAAVDKTTAVAARVPTLWEMTGTACGVLKETATGFIAYLTQPQQ